MVKKSADLNELFKLIYFNINVKQKTHYCLKLVNSKIIIF